MAIETAESYFATHNSSQALETVRTHERAVKVCPVSNKIRKAFINHGRWLVMCPSCLSSEFLFGDKLFFCSQCRNQGNGGQLYKVTLPTKRKEIEALLGKRPIVNQNWLPGEKVEDLEAENIKFGVS